MKKLLILSASAAVLITSCKKNDEDKVTRQAHLLNGKWFMESTKDVQTSPKDTVIDFSSSIEDCSKDDFLKFSVDGTYKVDEGATKCDPNDPQTQEAGTWKLIDNDSKLVLSYVDGSSQINDTSIIKTLNATTLQIAVPYNYTEDGIKYAGASEITLRNK